MENVNYIFGKTIDGRPITLDGCRVESFMIYRNKAGDTIVDIYFKSGEEVEVNAFTDEGDSIPDGLADCFLAAKKNPEILTRPYPVNLIGCDTVEGIEYFFDGNAVEYYITCSVSEEDMVELHFASGNVIEVLSALDENLCCPYSYRFCAEVMSVKTPINKKTLTQHFQYSWWMYLLSAVLCFFLWDLMYTVTAPRTPDNEKLELYLYAYGEENAVNDYLEKVHTTEMSDVTEMTAQYIMPDESSGPMVLATRIMAGEGDLYLLPRDFFQSYASQGLFVALDELEGIQEMFGSDRLCPEVQQGSVPEVHGPRHPAVHGRFGRRDCRDDRHLL